MFRAIQTLCEQLISLPRWEQCTHPLCIWPTFFHWELKRCSENLSREPWWQLAASLQRLPTSGHRPQTQNAPAACLLSQQAACEEAACNYKC